VIESGELECGEFVTTSNSGDKQCLKSCFQLILAPIVEYVLEAERCCPNQQIAVLIPELVQRRWCHHLLHNKRAAVLKALLLLKGNQRIIVINVPWYLEL
jgi:hypothetical protein